MGIISKVVGAAVKAVKSVAKSVSKVVSGSSRSAASSSGSIWSKVKSGVGSLTSKLTGKNSFVSRAFKSLSKTSGKTSVLKSLGKVFTKALKVGTKLCKRIPVIGAALTVLLEIPNIYKGYKKDGWNGVKKQLLGAGIELGCTALGAGIGALIGNLPGAAIGAIVGGIGGWILRDKYVPEPDDEDEEEKTTTSQEASESDVEQPAESPQNPVDRPYPVDRPSQPVNPISTQPPLIPNNPELPSNPIPSVENPELPGVNYPIKDLGEPKPVIQPVIIPPDTYTREEVKKLMSFGLSRVQILQLIKNGYSYHDVEMALLYEMLEDNRNASIQNPYRQRHINESFRFVG